MKCKHEPNKHYELKATGYILCLECGKQMSKEELK